MSFITAILECLGGTNTTAHKEIVHATTLDGDTKYHIQDRSSLASQNGAEVAHEFLELLRSAETSGEELKLQLQSVVHTHDWSENLAQRILDGVVRIIEENREKIGPVMREALVRAEDAANDLFTFAKEHPYQTAGYATIIAIGILVPYAPWIIRALGFGARGPVLGWYFPRPSEHEETAWMHLGSFTRLRH